MNPQNGQTSLDYLNQIAPEAPKKPIFKFNKGTILLLVLAAIILVVIMANIATSISNASKEPWQRLSARLTTTAKVVDNSSRLIKNSELRSINSDLKLYITNTQRDIAAPLTTLGIDTAKLPGSITTSENGEAMLARLENGRLNAKYDSTYAREMSYQLATLRALIKQLYQTDVSAKTKALLKNAYDNLQPTYKSVTEFSASNE